MAQAAPRPRGVTIVVVLLLLTAVFDIIAGIRQVLSADGDGVALAAGIIALGVAVVYLLLAKGIADGRPVARLIVAVVSTLAIVTSISGMFLQPQLWVGLIVQVLLELVVLALLYSERANAFFDSRAARAEKG